MRKQPQTEMPTEGKKKNDVPASQRATEFMTGYCRSTRICYCHESENVCPLFLSTSTNQPIGCHVRLKFSSGIESILVVLRDGCFALLCQFLRKILNSRAITSTRAGSLQSPFFWEPDRYTHANSRNLPRMK